jgi:hypothetical protein
MRPLYRGPSASIETDHYTNGRPMEEIADGARSTRGSHVPRIGYWPDRQLRAVIV